MDVYLHASSLHHINKTKSDAKGLMMIFCQKYLPLQKSRNHAKMVMYKGTFQNGKTHLKKN